MYNSKYLRHIMLQSDTVPHTQHRSFSELRGAGSLLCLRLVSLLIGRVPGPDILLQMDEDVEVHLACCCLGGCTVIQQFTRYNQQFNN